MRASIDAVGTLEFFRNLPDLTTAKTQFLDQGRVRVMLPSHGSADQQDGFGHPIDDFTMQVAVAAVMREHEDLDSIQESFEPL
jgi:hypothetical protein